MPDEADSAALCEAIADGTFPQSEQLLTSELSAETIPLLLEHISKTRSEISEEIKAASEDDAGDVDEWIAQAKRVQEDIARCKEESKRIVEEHQHVQALRDEATDYERKVELLEAEIDFTETLRRELDSANTATAALREVEDCLLEGNPSAAAAKIQELDKKTENTVRSRTSTILRDLRDELRLKARVQLQTKLSLQISVHRDQHEASITVRPDELDGSATNSGVLLRALDQLGDPHDSLEPLMDKLKGFVLQPLRQSSRLRMTTYEVRDNSIRIQLGREGSSTETALDFVLAFLKFLQSSVASTIRLAGAKAIMSDLMTLLVNDWLNPGLPTDLTMLDGLDDLQARVRRLLKELESLQWEGQKQLQDWIEDIPRAWLNKRKAATLDAVRKAFVTSKGTLRQVERVEREIMPTRTDEHGSEAEGETNDWDANWDDDNKQKQPSNESGEAQEDEDASGWGFDDEDDTDSNDKANDEDKDGGDAWGWGDDSPVETKSEPPSKDDHRQPNGAKDTKHEEQEITLTELYSITDIPDHLVQIIGQDISDAQTILETGHDGLDSSSASRGLLALPTLALAMFRATAPSYYGASPSLTDIHRYNDSLYIAERLRGISLDSRMLPNVESDVKAMEKFARLAYSKEMETQRLIVWDLLEGAQGFTSCTQFPYSQEIENAVSAVVDRIRAMNINWKPILSTSALMQSIGSLVTMVIGKVIDSIEEMEDISEPESRRLTAFCQQIASLDELFLSSPPTSAGAEEREHEHEPVPMTAVYVTNWLKFQYLINILESSLVDIKYLWTEGELSLEFSAEEVVDLIRALFAESAHRRGAIASIKGGRSSR
jgi:centromere/kinetochore protein ZW10